MSAGGVFQLIANKGKSDSLLLATNLLNQRLRQCACNRKAQGLPDPTPTLADIEKTHVLFVNAHFKPFAATGYEYNKVRTQSGTPQFGNTVTFSIPQFGDFFGDMVIRADLAAATAYVGSHEGTYVDLSGNTHTSATTPLHRVKYCDHPANRLFKKVKFDVNGNPLDEYVDVSSAMLEKFTVAPGKRAGYNRLTGQENPIVAQGGLFHSDEDAREQKMILNGMQTPKEIQPAATIWHKLRFWFNDDCRLAVPSVSIPYGQRFITVELASKGDMIEEVINHYVSAPAVAGQSFTAGSEQAVSDSAANTTMSNDISMELYVNNIFVNPEVHDIFIKRIGFSLIRVYRYHTAAADPSSAGEMLLSSLKWPIEYMWVGVQQSNHRTAPGRAQKWHRFDSLTQKNASGAAFASVASDTTGDTAGDTLHPIQDGVTGISYFESANAVDKLTLKAHGITLYDNFEAAFYNAYIPFSFGGSAIMTPDQDQGVMMINFALYPGSAYQPSGHLNVSRAREFYISWPASSGAAASTLHAVAKAINFLLITDGSAVLRYST